jgi:sulfoxide reductase catalytic subunit YedY
MLIQRRKGWEIAESHVTPEGLAVRRRSVLAGVAGMASAAFAGSAFATANPKYTAGRTLTPEADATSYNNFYEFGTDKGIARAAQRLPVSPWSIEIAGLVAQPRMIGIEDLLKQVSVEERVYRHRCVEAWGMTVPWTGFPVSALVKLAEPTSGAKYVAFETLNDPKHMPGVRSGYFTWPYIDGVTMEEANNDLAFLATGMYGHDLPKQDGAPIRLVLPWKYGFKSVKSIVKVTFTDAQPPCFWQAIQPSEYGFWANVNPEVPHPRWSQATERLLSTDERVPTQKWNGYGEFVAPLYAGMTEVQLFR